MKFNSWQICGLSIVAILGAIFVTSTSAQFTTPAWPPVTDSDIVFTTPPWPPNTETDDLITTTTLDPSGTTPPTPPGSGSDTGDESNAWMVVGIIFIVLTIALAILAIYLYVSRKNRPLRPGRSFVLPRVNETRN